MSKQPRIRLGTVGRPHGLRGGLRVNLDNAGSDALNRLLEARQPIVIDGQPHLLRRASPLGARSATTRAWMIELADVGTREQADLLYQRVIEAEREALGPLDEGEYYYTDLVGLSCVDESGALLGSVAQVYEAGASDILILATAEGERELPFIEDVVLSVDLAARRIVLRIPEDFISTPAEATEPDDAV